MGSRNLNVPNKDRAALALTQTKEEGMSRPIERENTFQIWKFRVITIIIFN